ncbi:MAG: hypothetical protein WCT77_00985 [Bacteroidota bacterium]|jgi:hypothetical protein
MKKFTTLSFVVTMSFLLIALSIGYYLIIYIPSRDAKLDRREQDNSNLKYETNIDKNNIDSKTKCQSDGVEFITNKKKEFKARSTYIKNKEIDSVGVGHVEEPQYKLSSSLDTCLVLWNSYAFNIDYESIFNTMHITDIYSNTDLSKWTQKLTDNPPPQDVVGSENEFNQSRKYYGFQ